MVNIKDFGTYLVEKGLITVQTLERAKKEAIRRKESLEFILLDTGAISERDMAEAMGSAFELEFIDLDEVDVDEKTARTVPEHMAFRYTAVPVKKDKNLLILAMADPTDVTAIDDFRFVSGCDIRPAIATASAIMRQLRRCFRD